MAPRRGNHGHGQGQGQGNGNVFIGNYPEIPGYGNLGLDPEHVEKQNGNATKCACPTECLRVSSGLNLDSGIRLDDLHDVVRVVCNNEQCQEGRYMHRECFDAWEQMVLTYLKSCGRARSWSERQRHQNLWTKKGYDLAFKACGCKCGRGHLKKDLDWIPPQTAAQRRVDENSENKKKKKNKSKNLRPSLAISAHSVGSPNSNSKADGGMVSADAGRMRTGSLSSSNGSASPPVTSEPSVSPAHSGSSGSSAGMIGKKKSTSKADFFSDRAR